MAVQDSTPKVEKFVSSNKITYAVALDDQNLWAKAFGGITVMPTTVFLDSQGNVQSVHKGYIDQRQLEKTIRDYLPE